MSGSEIDLGKIILYSGWSGIAADFVVLGFPLGTPVGCSSRREGIILCRVSGVI